MLPTVAAWHHLLRAFDVKKPFKTNLRLYALSSLPKHIPGFVVFITSRTLLYQEEGIPAGISVAATGVETALLALTGFIVSMSIIGFGGEQLGASAALQRISPLAVMVLLVLVLLLPWMKRVIQWILTRLKVENAPRLVSRELSYSLIWMFLAWGGGGIILYLLALAISPLPITYLPEIIGMWAAASAVSLTIGIGVQGLGLREVTLGALLSILLPPLPAIVLAIAFRFLLIIAEFFWVWIFVGLTRPLTGRKGEK
jgi:hypothetical protein